MRIKNSSKSLNLRNAIKVVWSTLAAETLALEKALESCFKIKSTITEVVNKNIT